MKKWKRVRYFSTLFLLGALLGVIGAFLAGFVVGYTGDYLSFKSLQSSLVWIARGTFIVIICSSLHFLDSAKKDYRYYSENELEDDEYDRFYRKTFRSLEYATIGFDIAGALTILSLFLGMNLVDLEDALSYQFSLVDVCFLVSLVVLQKNLYKLTSKIREHSISLFPTLQELKDYIYSYDEGERESIFENNFLIVFGLNQRILPIIYAVLFIISMVTGEIQIVAYLVIAFIHIYINVQQFKRVRNYFK
ncbi:DUF3169 family protein [Streptococcus marmotae]|uniref:DUF3169 family protein n=1 Tax=Streptococcus marmotae TaxID=1825069 RepID=UPI00082ABBC4|nr:DUF3169 family protein [Streptococcus marmotae]